MAGYWLALLLAAQAGGSPSPHVIAVERVDPGQWIDGADYLLIAEAARHPQMRGANLSCYRINVRDVRGTRQVSFVGRHPRIIEEETPEGIVITYLPPDPNCRSISFEMDRNGRVARVIRSRH